MPLTLVRKLVGRVLAGAFLAWAAYRVYIWRKYHALTLEFGLPVVPLQDKRWFMQPFGNFFVQLRNWHRVYDLKKDAYDALGSPLTVAVLPPIWTPEPIVNTIDPVVVRHILKDKFDVYLKPESTISCLRDLLGEGIFAINHGPHAEDGGKFWALQRKTASKVFTNNNFKNLMFNTFSDHSLKVAAEIEKRLDAKGRGVVELQTLMFAYTLDSIGRIGFGVELNTIEKGDDVPFAKAFDRAQLLSTERFLSPLWNIKPLGLLLYKGERELRKHIATLNEFCYDIIAKRKKELGQGTSSKGDILTLFLQERLGLTDLELRDVVMSFLIAGRDTTACTLSFALMLLATNMEWQEKLRAEVKDKLRHRDGDRDRILDSNDISQMKLLQNIILETLRLYPPVPVDVKFAAVDDVLPGGHKVPAGTRITYDNYVLGRMERIWGPDVNEFNPDRWANMANVPTPYEFPMFQAGPRVCLGESLAKFEAALLLGVLVDRFRFAPADEKVKFTYMPGITLKVKDGLNLLVERVE